MLKITGLTKRFSGTLALDGVDLEMRAGEVHALLGENGAGKSTLIKILAGVHQADAGEIALHGRVVNPTSDELPINFIHQDLGLVDTMSVAENIAVLAGYPRRARPDLLERRARGGAEGARPDGRRRRPGRARRLPCGRREIDRRHRPRHGDAVRPPGS